MLYHELQRAYAERQVLDQLKQDFILQVSHEFRTPVTAIQGYVTLIGRHGHKLEQAKLDQYANEIHQSTSQLMGMVSRLQDASSIGTQPLSVTLGPVNVHDVASKALADQEPEAKLRVEIEAPEDLWVIGDAERVKAVLSNLVSNALKYSNKMCRVTATIASREALAAQGRHHAMQPDAVERWAVVAVLDQGEGIPPEEQGKLFQKFVRLQRSLVTSVRGTGLGLWICRQYLDAMGGDIWVESAFAKGSLFQFILPLAEPPSS
jgi:signal transduction histidine kinase